MRRGAILVALPELEALGGARLALEPGRLAAGGFRCRGVLFLAGISSDCQGAGFRPAPWRMFEGRGAGKMNFAL